MGTMRRSIDAAFIEQAQHRRVHRIPDDCAQPSTMQLNAASVHALPKQIFGSRTATDIAHADDQYPLKHVLAYSRIQAHRRPSTPDVHQPPVRSGNHREMASDFSCQKPSNTAVMNARLRCAKTLARRCAFPASRIAGQPWLLLSTHLQSRLQDTQYSAIMARCYYFTVNRSEMIWAAECAFMALHKTSMHDLAKAHRNSTVLSQKHALYTPLNTCRHVRDTRGKMNECGARSVTAQAPILNIYACFWPLPGGARFVPAKHFASKASYPAQGARMAVSRCDHDRKPRGAWRPCVSKPSPSTVRRHHCGAD